MSRTHGCPGDCGAQVPNERLACPDCWARLPVRIRREVSRHYRRHTDRHRLAVQRAYEWYIEHPLSTQDS